MSAVLKLQVLTSQQARVGDQGLEFGKAVKAAVLALLDAPTRPRPESLARGEPKVSVTLWLNDEEEARVRGLAAEAGFDSAGIYLTALLHASLLDPIDATNKMIDRVTDALGLASREAQRLFAAQISGALFNAPVHAVVLAEAATGIGKSLGFLSVALDALERDPERSIIVAAPAYNVLHQSFGEWRDLAKKQSKTLPAMPEAVMVMGQQEFVSEHALRALLEGPLSDAERQAWGECATAWIGAGAPPPPDGITQAWTQAGIRAACGEFPHGETVRLASDAAESDAGRAAYAAQFGVESDGHVIRAQVVFCTHAMLAVEVKRRRIAAQREFRETYGQRAGDQAWKEVEALRADPADGDTLPVQAYALQNDLLRTLERENECVVGGRLPDNALLIIDEAHLLEENFARIFATGESIWRLVSAAKTVSESQALTEPKRAALRKSLHELITARDGLRNLGATGQGDGRMFARTADDDPQDQPVITALVALQRSLAPFAGKQAAFKRGTADPDAERAKERIKRALDALDLGLRSDAGQLGVAMRVTWSPTLAWPSFEAGRMDVTSYLDFLWSNVAGQSLCVSATLLTQTGVDPAAAIQRMLGIRPAQAVVLPAVHPLWVTEPVEVRVPPKPEARPYPGWLSYPRRQGTNAQSPAALAQWIEAVSEYVAGVVIHNEARKRGGVLVLLTSHSDRAAVSEWLAGRLGADAVVTQVPGRPLEALKAEFIARRARGVPAVLVGVGACWTGLDLSDRNVPAEQDTLITDLVIPRLPIGTNRTLTHLARKRRLGVHAAEMLATAVTLRQGVGRLVRRQGVVGRVLHVLDGRNHSPGFQYGRVMDRILGVYPNRTEAKPWAGG